MITKFKIFENNTDKKIYYHTVKGDDVEKLYKKIKKSGINTVFFEIPDNEEELAVICFMSDEEKAKNLKKGYWGEDPKTSAYIMVNFEPIDPERFMKECEIRKNAKKYNL